MNRTTINQVPQILLKDREDHENCFIPAKLKLEL